MRLSIIIPMYNCENEIGNLLNSILAQNWDKSLYQVIACDDNSTDNTINIVKNYTNIMNIIFCQTKQRQIHCPGNTRLDALKYVNTDWVVFIDNDDEFEPNTFDLVWKKIIQDNEQYMICGNFREYKNNSYGSAFCGEVTWLHGKWYNMNFLKKYNINFKEDLESHEDLYFNALVLGHLIGNNTDYNYLNHYIYKWNYRPNSLSRKFYNEKYSYIEVYLKDFILAIIEPNILLYKQYPNKIDFYLHQCIICILRSYFYLQCSLQRFSLDDILIKKNYLFIKKAVNDVTKAFNINKNFIIEYIYQDPLLYHKIKQNFLDTNYYFIEKQSFNDFIENL